MVSSSSSMENLSYTMNCSDSFFVSSILILTVVLQLLFFYKFSLFLAALGFCCGVRPFSYCGEWRLLFVVVCGLLIMVASLVVEHRL